MSKNIRAKKHLGQNFLHDKNIIAKIIEVAQIENKEVLEIGPGQGALTQYLIPKSKNLLAYEIDKDMIEILQAKFPLEKFQLVHQDFLKANLDWNNKKVVVSNLPYYITSKILFKIFENVHLFESLTIMVQEEVANRIIAKVNAKDYGKLSISAQYFATIKKEFTVPPQSFNPIPKVNSAIITLKFNKALKLETKAFLEFVKKSFAMKRKTLFNNWKNIFETTTIKNIFLKFNLKDSVRPQEITLEQYQDIFKFVSHKE